MQTRVPKAPFPAIKKRRQILGSAAVFLPLAIALTGTQLSNHGESASSTHPTLRESAAASSSGVPFQTGCGDLPFQEIAIPHWLDNHCGPEGVASSDQANRQQNELKNNFCRHSQPVRIKPADLVA